ncbi:hydrolase [Clostridium oceanicum]|uniref:Hydrolase n=1 Tax=Clostridium oceanicum TaxID=1543 RepID=A0ABN1JBJ6_9CLOT
MKNKILQSSRPTPEVRGVLRNKILEVPLSIKEASGIRIFGKTIKSLVYSTDVAVIKNTNADAIMAVYPFTPQPIITQALVTAADVPVFCGVGGGLTSGKRVVNLALDAEFKGVMAVVLNSPITNEVVKQLKETIDIPIVVTVVSQHEDIRARLESGVSILNVSGGKNTSNIVKSIRKEFPNIPIIATGGLDDDTIIKTIEAGANCITYTPPSSAYVFKDVMKKYRFNYRKNHL